MKKYQFITPMIPFLFYCNQGYAEQALYDIPSNTLTIPIVSFNNEKVANVKFACDSTNGITCVLLSATFQNCSQGTYAGNLSHISDNYYSVNVMSANGIEYGGIQVGGEHANRASSFAASWISSKKNKNPYLRGENLSKFIDNQAYGVVGKTDATAYPGFSIGELVAVTGDIEGYTIMQLSNGASATFNAPKNLVTRDSCVSSTGNNYRGDVSYLSDNYYSISIANNSTGTIQVGGEYPNRASSFSAGWGVLPRIMDTYNAGTVGKVNVTSYPNFSVGDNVFITDIGNGIAITSFDSETGKPKGTAVFIKEDNL